MHKTVAKLIREVQARGFVVDTHKTNHIKIRNQDGGLVCVIGARIGSGRGEANMRAELKRRGVLG